MWFEHPQRIINHLRVDRSYMLYEEYIRLKIYIIPIIPNQRYGL